MDNKFTLKDFRDPSFYVSSTARLAVSVLGGKMNTFSFPPILYYGLKAKRLASMGVFDEATLIEETGISVANDTAVDIRKRAKDVYSDLIIQDIDIGSHVSSAIQSRLLNYLLDVPETGDQSLSSNQAVTINATRANKNITIPYYLMTKVTQMLNSEKAAKLLIQQLMTDIKEELIESGDLVINNGKEVLSNRAAMTSWSRKLHNCLILNLIEMSDIQQLKTKPSVLDAKMLFEPKLQTKKL